MERQGTSKVSKVENKDQWVSFLNTSNSDNRLVVAHFGASWCIPSVAMNSFFEEMATTHPDVLFLNIDVDDVKEVASEMEVKAMPTFILIKDSKPVDKLVGANPEEINKRIDGFLQSTGVDMA
ncbi:hypothetical protein RND81_07G135400 [Saponaria officinalis]|uniref:Thioredoxin domain-containing protein n=1 Tax=Saponaria officinalis TaxID=3572 RepID=A0AAW1JUF7_SAPOF